MEYELINPSDPYTFIAADYETAVLAVFCLGPAYGARPKDGGEDVPIFLFGGAVKWYAEKFGHCNRQPGEESPVYQRLAGRAQQLEQHRRSRPQTRRTYKKKRNTGLSRKLQELIETFRTNPI